MYSDFPDFIHTKQNQYRDHVISIVQCIICINTKANQYRDHVISIVHYIVCNLTFVWHFLTYALLIHSLIEYRQV
jgi:hypothetical protein